MFVSWNRYPLFLSNNLPSSYYFFTAPLKLSERSSWRTNTLPESTILVSLVLSINPLYAGQIQLLSPVRYSEKRNQSKDKEMDLASWMRTKSTFTSLMFNNHMRHMYVAEVLTDLARILLAIVEWPFNLSSNTWWISGTSCWVLNWTGACLLVESFLQSIHKMLEGSRGVVTV